MTFNNCRLALCLTVAFAAAVAQGDDWKYVTAFESLEEANLWEIDGADQRALPKLKILRLRNVPLAGNQIAALKALRPGLQVLNKK